MRDVLIQPFNEYVGGFLRQIVPSLALARAMGAIVGGTAVV